MTSLEYNSADFYPAAPTIDVKIVAHGSSDEHKTALMLLDLGADMTCLPRGLLEELHSRRTSSVEVLGYSRKPVIQRTSFIDFDIAGWTFENVETLPVDSDYGLLGRDVLNQLILRLDGPALVWSILAD